MARDTVAPPGNRASVNLVGDALKDFNAIKQHITKQVPGIRPSNPDVLSHALHRAAQSLEDNSG